MQMCIYANVQIVVLIPEKKHLHICTSAYSHINLPVTKKALSF